MFFPQLQARFDIHKKRSTFARFPHGYKRNLIFIKSITFAYFLVFPTATSAIWYSQIKCQLHPFVSPRLQARFDIHKKCQLHPFRCFPNGYKRDLIFTKSGNCAYSVLSHFPAFPTVLNSYSTAIFVCEKPISSTGRPKDRYCCPAGAKIWDPRHLYSNTLK